MFALGNYYRPQTKLRRGNFLHLSVSHSVHGGCLPQCMLGYIPPGETPQADTPWTDTPRQTPHGQTPLDRHPQQTATAADGTHPTGMFSCLNLNTAGTQRKLSWP